MVRVDEGEGGSRMQWWIDVVIQSMTVAEKSTVANILGLEENCFVLGGNLPTNFSSRINQHKDVLSIKVQSLWTRNIPLVHPHPHISRIVGRQ